ncbi:MAG: SRPBCC family protein [Leptospirales bacterium]
MAREIETTIDIHAPVADIWQILTDLPRYGEWNPLVIQAAGPLTVGQRLEIAVQLPGRRPMSFSPTLVALVPEREIRWLGTFGVATLFAGEHFFLLIPQVNGTTRLKHSERFTGILPAFMGQKWYERVRCQFESMNQALKQRAEALEKQFGR